MPSRARSHFAPSRGARSALQEKAAPGHASASPAPGGPRAAPKLGGFGLEERRRDFAPQLGSVRAGEGTARAGRRGKAASRAHSPPLGEEGGAERSLPPSSPTPRPVSEGAQPVPGSRGEERGGSLSASTYRGYPAPEVGR